MSKRPSGLVAYEVQGPDESLFVFAFPRACPGEETLSPGEAQVIALARLGMSDAQIAIARSVSPRTVANQLASAYRKLAIPGRSALR